MKCTSRTFLACHTDLSSHQFHQLVANRQTQAAAIASAEIRLSRLGKCREDPLLILRPNPRTGIGNRKTQPLSLGLGDSEHAYLYSSLLSEFEGVAQQIDQDLVH